MELREKTVLCEICFNVAEKSPCRICTSPDRDKSIICVTEDPLDVLAIEAATNYKGLYHVLHGVISPVNRVGPEDLKIKELIDRVRNLDSAPPRKAGDRARLEAAASAACRAGEKSPNFPEAASGRKEVASFPSGSGESVSFGEVILATNPSMEGEATAMYLKKELKPLSMKVTRIARGLPTGGDLEYADQMTLTRALEARSEY